MNNFFNIVAFEYKKIFKRKGSVAAIILMMIFAAISPALILIGNVYVDGKIVESSYDAMIKEREYAQALAGRSIESELLLETREAYSKVPSVERYGETPEYELYARPYSEIFQLAKWVYGKDIRQVTDDEINDFYKIRHEKVSESIGIANIGNISKEKLIRIDSRLETPFVFDYIGAYDRFIAIMYSTGLFMALVTAICLAPIFAGEYASGADQLALSSRLGKSKLIGAKLFTGMSFAFAYGLIIVVLTYVVCVAIFGFGGANAPMQVSIRFPFNFYDLTMGQIVLIFSIVIIFAQMLVAAFTMLLSSRMKTPFGVAVITNLIIIIPMMAHVPKEYGFFYRLYMLMPTNMMAVWTAFSDIQYEFFGLSLEPYKVIPAFAALIGAAMLPFAWKSFKSHQV